MVTSTLPWRVMVRGSDKVLLGQVDTFTTLRAVLHHRKGGTWSLRLPAEHPQSALFTSGRGVLLVPPWSTSAPLFSGPITSIEVGTDGGAVDMVVSGVDDTALLNDRLVLPDPSRVATSQDTEAYYTNQGPGENVIRRVVSRNIGETALADRRAVIVGGESVGSPAGATVYCNSRMEPLGDVVEALATSAGLSVRIIQSGTNLNFEVWAGTDRSAYAEFSEHRGNLNSWRFGEAVPKGTRVVVGGQGEGTARTFVERSSTTSETQWSRRIEAFRDARDTNDTTVLNQRGDEYLADNAPTAGLSLEPVDIPGLEFGLDYTLGDTVTVVAGSATWTETLSSVELTLDDSGSTVKPSVGSSDLADNTPALYQRVRDLTRRLNLIERRT